MRNIFLTSALALAVAAGAMAGQQAAAPKGQTSAQPAQKPRAPKTQAEAKALQALFQATTPDAQIAAAEDFIAKFPKSDFKALAFLGEAQGYLQKKDTEQVIVFGEQALDANPDDGTKMQTLILMAQTLVAKTGEFDLDKEEKLAKVEKYTNGVSDMLKTMSKPNPALTDEQWDTAKADMTSDVHAVLAMDQMVRKNYDQAIVEFKTALEATKTPEPATQVRLAVAYEKAGKFDEAIAVCTQVMAVPDVPVAIRQVAQAARARAFQAKGGAKPAAAATPAPAATPSAPAAAPQP